MRGTGREFEEFIAKRCEEILKEDVLYWNMIKKATNIHESLKPELTREQLEMLFDLENATAEMHARAETLIYSYGVSDGIAMQNLTKYLTLSCN